MRLLAILCIIIPRFMCKRKLNIHGLTEIGMGKIKRESKKRITLVAEGVRCDA